MIKPMTAVSRRLGGFRMLSAEQLKVVPAIFGDPAALDANLREAEKRHDYSPDFFWEFHHMMRDRVRAHYPHDNGMFNCIAKTGAVIQDNQITYIIYRRLTLAAFLLAAYVLAPWNVQPLASSLGLAPLAPPIAQLVWYGGTLATWGLMLTINRGIKLWHDSCVSNTISNLVVHISAYNHKLHDEGFKRCLEHIDAEAADYGSHADEKMWPSRAKKWSELAFWNYKRIEQIERMTENYAWDTERALRFFDGLSRLLNILVYVGFVLALWLSKPQVGGAVQELGSTAYPLIAEVLLTAALAFIGWDWFGKEEKSVFHKSMLAPEKKELWISSANFRDNFAKQIYKDKARIQRERPFHGAMPTPTQDHSQVDH